MKHFKFPWRRTAAALLLAFLCCTQAFAALPSYLVPGGSTAGIRLCTGGLLITALDDGAPAQKAGLRAGDTILKIDGTRVTSTESAAALLKRGEGVHLCVLRGQKQAEYFLTPQKTKNGYRLGISVRDNISGIGTITFDVSTALGSVSQNETHGIFGTLNTAPSHAAVAVAERSQIHTGAAVILANVDGTDVREYCVRIEKLYPQAQNGRNLLLTVTDERLLSKTGGIVQGMSGSPILQDGRLVGAVTHVLVNRPEQGYGIFIDSMLQQCSAYR